MATLAKTLPLAFNAGVGTLCLNLGKKKSRVSARECKFVQNQMVCLCYHNALIFSAATPPLVLKFPPGVAGIVKSRSSARSITPSANPVGLGDATAPLPAPWCGTSRRCGHECHGRCGRVG